VLAPVCLVAMVLGGFVATLGALGAVLPVRTGQGRAGLHHPIILYLFVTAIGTATTSW
jgi:hypothetical protein